MREKSTANFLKHAPRFLILVFSLYLAGAGLQLTLGRYYLIRAGLWTNAMNTVRGSWIRARESFKLSARWDPSNVFTWTDRARLEYVVGNVYLPRRAYATTAQRIACGIEPYRKVHWKTLAFFDLNKPIP